MKNGSNEKNSRLVISEKQPNHFLKKPNEVDLEIKKKFFTSPKITLLYNQSE
ncbi:MAG: hypothetical protein QXM96_02355 [Candidatus Woesearchaeota archaeon]